MIGTGWLQTKEAQKKMKRKRAHICSVEGLCDSASFQVRLMSYHIAYVEGCSRRIPPTSEAHIERFVYFEITVGPDWRIRICYARPSFFSSSPPPSASILDATRSPSHLPHHL